MGRRKTPPEKKQLDYDEQIRPYLEAPHAFRKNWPKKKARANRRTRRLADTLIRESVKRDDVEDLTSRAVKNVRKGKDIRKTQVVTLGQRVNENREARARARKRG